MGEKELIDGEKKFSDDLVREFVFQCLFLKRHLKTYHMAEKAKTLS